MKKAHLVVAAVLAFAAAAAVGMLGRGGAPSPVTPALAEARFVREPGLDRSGNDMARELLEADAGVEACERLCLARTGCAAYTFVKRSSTVPRPICWLKDRVPHGYESSCCVSGVLKR